MRAPPQGRLEASRLLADAPETAPTRAGAARSVGPVEASSPLELTLAAQPAPPTVAADRASPTAADAPPRVARRAAPPRVYRRASQPAGAAPDAPSQRVGRSIALAEAAPTGAVERRPATPAGPSAERGVDAPAGVDATPALLRVDATATTTAAEPEGATRPPVESAPIEGPGAGEPDPADLERLAQQVYARLKRRFAVERERSGLGVRR